MSSSSGVGPSTSEGYRYLAEWSDAFEVRLILVRDWPTLLKLRALAAPLLSLVELEVRLEE